MTNTNIKIGVVNRVATPPSDAVIVCGNSGYTLTFEFDSEWSAETTKIARFVWFSKNKTYSEEIPFDGNTVEVPILSNTNAVYAGVYAGNLRTTTPAKIVCEPSILCYGQDANMNPSDLTLIKGQIAKLVDALRDISVDPTEIKNAVMEYLTKNPPKVTETDPTVPAWAKQPQKPKYTAKEVGAVASNELSTAVNDALAQAKASGEFNGRDGYTPVKGKDYFDGYTPVKGKDYFDGDDYVLTEADKEEIAEMVSGMVEIPTPDSGGNVDLTGVVKSVNGVTPDENGNVEITVSGGAAVATIEPADDDIPKVYFTGTLPTSKTEEGERLTMHYISKTADFIYPVTLNVQGSSSTGYPKKNFTLKPYKDATYEKKQKLVFKNWPEMNKFVLKAHWVDHSHVRNVGSAKIWGKIVKSRSDYDNLPEELRNAPNNGATDGFTVKVFANGVYQGLYEWIVAKDKLFGQDKDIATHSILNSELNNQPTCAFATTTPTISGNWSEELQDSMTADTKTSMENWIKFVAGSTDEEFVANAENYFDVQSVIDADIFDRVFCTVDNLCRNQIVFKYDTKWFMGKWDLDAVLGLPPLPSQSFFAYNTEYQTGYVAYKDFGIINLLYQRVENLFLERFKARYAELRSGVLSIENILDVYERLTDVITTYDGLLAEDYASTTGGGAFTGIPHKTENNIQQIRNFVAQRIPYMDEVVKNMAGYVPCTGISLSISELTFTSEGTQTITANVTPDGCTDEITWESDNVSVATVKNGVVTPVSDGNATITAVCGEYSASCTVSVDIGETQPDYAVSLTPYDGSEDGELPVGRLRVTAGMTLIITYLLTKQQGYVFDGRECGDSKFYQLSDNVVNERTVVTITIPRDGTIVFSGHYNDFDRAYELSLNADDRLYGKYLYVQIVG